MPNTVVFLWISALGVAVPTAAVSPAPLTQPYGATRPSGSAAADLRDFGAARGLTFVPASNTARPRGLPANDAALVDALESELEQARTALSALEESAASARLRRVEGQLLDHPHLPQAAFLMGECLALQAQAAREHSPVLAQALDARRAELEGPRALSFGETAPSAAPATRHTLPVQGLDSYDELEVDGTLRGRARRLELGFGLHHVRVLRRERVVFAAFTEVVAEQQALSLPVPALVRCSEEDLLGAADVEPHVACPRWAKVREESPGVGVALCEHERCGAFVHWQRKSPAPFTPLTPERRGMPAWLGFALAGATVAAAGTLVLWQSGAFDRSRASAASWEYGGLNPQGLRF